MKRNNNCRIRKCLDSFDIKSLDKNDIISYKENVRIKIKQHLKEIDSNRCLHHREAKYKNGKFTCTLCGAKKDIFKQRKNKPLPK